MAKRFILTLLFLFAIFTNAAFSQDIAPEKRAVIKEIILVTNAEKQVIETADKVSTQLSAVYPVLLESNIESRKDLTADEKELLKKSIVDSHQNFSQRFKKKLFESLSFSELAESSLYPLYDKFFSVEELRQLLEFYKSPVGEKLAEISPEFAAESVRLSQIYLLPKLDGITKSIMDEDLAKKSLGASDPPPPRKN